MRRLLPFLIIACASHSALAGAWLMPKGDGLAITQLTYFSSDAYWDVAGERTSQDTFKKWEIQPYVEYGLTDKITIGGSGYLQRVGQSGKDNTGVADPEFFLRSRLWYNDREVLSIQPLIKLPSRFHHNDRVPRGGSKSSDAELSLLYGKSLDIFSNRDYLDMRIGYRLRDRGLEPQYKADIALGVSPWERWQFIPAIRVVQAEMIDDNQAFSQTGDLDYDLLKAELTVAYRLDDGGWIQATYFDHMEGSQTGDGNGIALGYAVRF
jgi:hypothetical protein